MVRDRFSIYRFSISWQFVSTALLSITLLAPSVSHAASFDGRWSVVIITTKGNCDKAYRYALNISAGRITYGGQSGFTAAGRVAPSGAVSVRVSRGNQAAQGSGRLSAKSGSGSWSAPSGGCSGVWRASKG